MSHTVAIVCRPQVAVGFALAGLQPIEASDGETAAACIAALSGDRDVGVILVEEPLHDALPIEARRTLADRPLPMIVPFPGPAWRTPDAQAHEYVVELLRQAIGYRVRLV